MDRSAEADIIANIPRYMGMTGYEWYEAGKTGLQVAHAGAEFMNVGARFGAHIMRCSGAWVPPYEKVFDAGTELLGRFAKDYEKPPYGITHTIINDEKIDVEQKTVFANPFVSLVHFERDTDREDPKVFLVTPMAGHYSSMLRGTAQGLLDEGMDVYMTDWHNARDIPTSAGDFGFEDYVDIIETGIKSLGPDVNVVAVCQPGVAVVAAVSHLADKEPSAQPASMVIMASPIDTRVAPTTISELADEKSMQWFKRNMIDIVPRKYDGAGREVHPGSQQLLGFVSLDPAKHFGEHIRFFNNRLFGHHEEAKKMTDFYDVYFAVSDMTAKFYLETIDKVFKKRELPDGLMTIHGDAINLAAISSTRVLTIEGGKDDITAPGQTSVLLDLLTGLDPNKQFQHLEPGVGHYGTFEGKKYRKNIAPRIARTIFEAAVDRRLEYSPAPRRLAVA